MALEARTATAAIHCAACFHRVSELPAARTIIGNRVPSLQPTNYESAANCLWVLARIALRFVALRFLL